jgi:hypothetical protein
VHQVVNQSRLYCDARSANHQDVPVLLFSTTFLNPTITWVVILVHFGIFVRFLWNLSNWPPGNEMWDRRMCRCMWIRLIWHEIMSCVCITVNSCYLLFVLAIRFREIVGYIIFAATNRLLWKFTELLFMTTLNSGLYKQVFWSSFCPSGLASNFSGPRAVHTLRPKRLSCPM